MESNSQKIILDTNIWISFLISKNYSLLDEIISSKKYKLIFSEELLDEFITVIKRPKLKKFFSKHNVENLLEIIQEYAEFVEVKSKVEICRDNKDNFLLSLSKDSKADFLITGDKDLLDLIEFETTKILTITKFLEKV